MDEDKDDDRTAALDRIAALLIETNEAAQGLHDEFLVYLVGVALLHVAEERGRDAEPPRRLVS